MLSHEMSGSDGDDSDREQIIGLAHGVLKVDCQRKRASPHQKTRKSVLKSWLAYHSYAGSAVDPQDPLAVTPSLQTLCGFLLWCTKKKTGQLAKRVCAATLDKYLQVLTGLH